MSEILSLKEWVARKELLKLDVRPFVGGHYVDSASTGRVDKIDPSNGEVLYTFCEGSEGDVDAAVKSARRVFEAGTWQHRPIAERKAILHRLADLVERDALDLALMEATEVGKPIYEATAIDVPWTAMMLRHYAEAGDHLTGNTYPTDGGSLAMTVRMARGVVSSIIGWNYPLLLAALKIGPALVTGNSLVLKPSELSSLSALRLAELALEAGVPPGVLNVVPGLGGTIGKALAHHNDVDMISFTGSTTTGKAILTASAASNMKRVVLECGGKSANIVFSDAPDIEAVGAGVFQRMFLNQGQVCTAGTRLIVQRSIQDQVLEVIERNIRTLKCGHPLDSDTSFGPLISQPQRDKVTGYIESGVSQGAVLYRGGGCLTGNKSGFHVEPTVFTGVKPSMRIAQEEIFGPVLSVMEFDTVDEAISLANDTDYGLAATAWTTSLNTTHRLIRDLVAGSIVIRATGTPSAGAAFGSLPVEPHRQSGFGVEGGLEGLSSYTISKTVEIFA